MKRWVLLALLVGVAVQANEQSAMNNLKQIGLAIAQWSSDHDDRLPDMRSQKNFKQTLWEFAPSEKIFLDPETGEPFRLNAAMTGHAWQEDADQVLVFTRARAEGRRLALFNDGHVQWVRKDTWEHLRRQQKIVDESADFKEQKLENLAVLGKALVEYVQDGDKTLPPLNDLAATEKVLLPYTQMRDVFVVPGTTEPYALNTTLAHRRFAEVVQPDQIVVVYEAMPTNETRAVLYLDGKVERVPEARWPELKERSEIR